MLQHLIEGNTNILGDLAKQDWRNVTALVKWDRRATTSPIAKLLVRAALPDFGKTKFKKNGDYFTGLENGNIAHDSCNGDVLNPHELRLHDGLPVFEQHGDDFLKIMIEFIQRFTLRVRAREAGHEPDEQSGLWATFNHCGIDIHDFLQKSVRPNYLPCAYEGQPIDC